MLGRMFRANRQDPTSKQARHLALHRGPRTTARCPAVGYSPREWTPDGPGKGPALFRFLGPVARQLCQAGPPWRCSVLLWSALAWSVASTSRARPQFPVPIHSMFHPECPEALRFFWARMGPPGSVQPATRQPSSGDIGTSTFGYQGITLLQADSDAEDRLESPIYLHRELHM
jgi:hypothetical protein